MADDVERVLDATDIVALITEHVTLKRSGRRWVGLCPFHSEDTASFSVNQEDGVYYCFGCQAKGNAITFVKETSRVNFVEALSILAEKAGITLSKDSGYDSKSAERRASLHRLLERASEYFVESLKDDKGGQQAREYLASRGIEQACWDTFQIGWSPSARFNIGQILKFPADLVVEAGLGYQDQSGNLRDYLRSRIVFPIRDTSGAVIGFGGRILPDALKSLQPDQSQPPKYKNSPETLLYSKRRVLYGLDLAKSEIVKNGEVVVCEGYTDVIVMHQSGIRNAVATCGTALSQEHFERLKNFAKRIVLSYDADKAGQDAIERLYQFENKHNVELYVASLPGGKDPAEIGVKDPVSLVKAVGESKPFLRFRVERVIDKGDLTTSEGRARAADAALALVAEHPNPLVRNDYVSSIASLSGLDLKSVESRYRDLQSRAQHSATGGNGVALMRAGSLRSHRHRAARPAIESLRLLVHDPKVYSEFIIPELFEEDAQVSLAQLMARAESVKEAAIAVEDKGGEVARLFFELASEEREVDPLDVVSRQVEVAATREIRRLSSRIRSRDFDGAQLQKVVGEIGEVRMWVEQLRDSPKRDVACGMLISWLGKKRIFAGEAELEEHNELI